MEDEPKKSGNLEDTDSIPPQYPQAGKKKFPVIGISAIVLILVVLVVLYSLSSMNIINLKGLMGGLTSKTTAIPANASLSFSTPSGLSYIQGNNSNPIIDYAVQTSGFTGGNPYPASYAFAVSPGLNLTMTGLEPGVTILASANKSGALNNSVFYNALLTNNNKTVTINVDNNGTNTSISRVSGVALNGYPGYMQIQNSTIPAKFVTNNQYSYNHPGKRVYYNATYTCGASGLTVNLTNHFGSSLILAKVSITNVSVNFSNGSVIKDFYTIDMFNKTVQNGSSFVISLNSSFIKTLCGESNDATAVGVINTTSFLSNQTTPFHLGNSPVFSFYYYPAKTVEQAVAYAVGGGYMYAVHGMAFGKFAGNQNGANYLSRFPSYFGTVTSSLSYR